MSRQFDIKSRYIAITALVLSIISLFAFVFYLRNGLGLAYNDARSHLDIGRRIVEGLKPGLAQIGSVWLPLPHLLMVPTIWIDWMWHTGLSGAIISMASYVATAVLIILYSRSLGISVFGQITAMCIFAFNLNVLFLQSTAMTELLLMAAMTMAAYQFLLWAQGYSLMRLVTTAIWVFIATLIRYDGWYLLFHILLILVLYAWREKSIRAVTGMSIFYLTLAGFGIFLWIGWNLLIFGDPLFFIFGPYSARAQQMVIEAAGMLSTKGNLGFSLFTYVYVAMLNIGIIPMITGVAGLAILAADRTRTIWVRLATTALIAPFIFNVLALYMGQSAIFLQGISAETWFNVRYGVLTLPGIAIWTGYLIDRAKVMRPFLVTSLAMVLFFGITSNDSVSIEDATVGSSQKNVTEVSGWLQENAAPQEGFVLISAASHDAIIFSSGMKMIRFIHEGTGKYWESATREPDKWARWIVMRTNDTSDQTFRLVNDSGQLYKYTLVETYPFADIYELKSEFMGELNTKPTLGKQR